MRSVKTKKVVTKKRKKTKYKQLTLRQVQNHTFFGFMKIKKLQKCTESDCTMHVLALINN